MAARHRRTYRPSCGPSANWGLRMNVWITGMPMAVSIRRPSGDEPARADPRARRRRRPADLGERGDRPLPGRPLRIGAVLARRSACAQPGGYVGRMGQDDTRAQLSPSRCSARSSARLRPSGTARPWQGAETAGGSARYIGSPARCVTFLAERVHSPTSSSGMCSTAIRHRTPPLPSNHPPHSFNEE